MFFFILPSLYDRIEIDYCSKLDSWEAQSITIYNLDFMAKLNLEVLIKEGYFRVHFLLAGQNGAMPYFRAIAAVGSPRGIGVNSYIYK